MYFKCYCPILALVLCVDNFCKVLKPSFRYLQDAWMYEERPWHRNAFVYTGQHNSEIRKHTSMLRVRFASAIPEIDRPRVVIWRSLVIKYIDSSDHVTGTKSIGDLVFMGQSVRQMQLLYLVFRYKYISQGRILQTNIMNSKHLYQFPYNRADTENSGKVRHKFHVNFGLSLV